MDSSDKSLLRFMKGVTPKRGRVLLVGSKVYPNCDDRRKMYKDCVGLDMFDGHGVDIVHDLEKRLPKEHGLFKHVDCCSVLEHVKRPWLMAHNIEKALEHGGTLLVSVPFVWRIHNYPGDFWRISGEALDVLFPAITWLDKAYMTNGVRYDRPRSREEDGSVWFERSELFAFGVKR